MNNIKIIDYITLLNPRKTTEKEKQALSKVRKRLLKLSKECNVKIITAESPYNEMLNRS